jgi:transcriptional regulator EpsA
MDGPSKATGMQRPAFAGITHSVDRLVDIANDAPRNSGKNQLTADESERILRIVGQATRINRHFELFQLLQGEVQYFIPHQIMIGAWSDFIEPNLNLDVVSAIADVRTERLRDCNIENLFGRLYFRWLANDRRPLLFDGAAAEMHTHPACNCALHKSLQRMRTVVVHGFHDVRDGTSSLYLAAAAESINSGGSIRRFHFLLDLLIAQIDTAFRRVSGLKLLGASTDGDASVLSCREKEILAWVSEGRTNQEISSILAISAFTVKNHVQRIIKKLRATNRTEAAAKYRRLVAGMRRQIEPVTNKVEVRGGASVDMK